MEWNLIEASAGGTELAWGGDMSPDPSVLKMEEAEHALCPVSRPCSAGIEVLSVQQSKPLPG